MSGVTVVYLGGFGRSGSTLVERMLGAAHGWVNVGELVDLATQRRRTPTSSAGAGSTSRSARCGRRSARSPSAAGPRRSWTGSPDSSAPRPANATCPGLLGPRRRASRRAQRPADGVRPHLHAPSPRRPAPAWSSTPRRDPPSGRRSPARPASTCGCSTSSAIPRAVAWSWKRHRRAAPRHLRQPRRCGGSPRTGQPHSGARSSSRCRPSPASAASRRRGFATRTSSPTRSGRWSKRPPRSAFRSPPPTSRRSTTGRVVLGPSHGLSGNPSQVPLRCRRAPPRRRLDDARCPRGIERSSPR